MPLLALLPTIVCFLLLGAHYLRELVSGGPPHPLCAFLVAMCVITPFFLLVRSRFILHAMQLLLLLASWEWFATALDIVRTRLHDHKPFRTALIILMSVALFNWLAALLLQLPPVRRRYPTGSVPAPPPT